MEVSVLLLTYNEQFNLPDCLDAIAWCDDIIIVDSGSTDATLEIAHRGGARVLSRKFDNFASQRNFGLTEGLPKHQWVLHLDADEVVTAGLRDRLRSLEPREGIDAYRVASKMMLNGHWLRYAGMYPSYQVRLGHRERLRFKQVGHGQREDLPSERIDTLDEPYLHYNFSHGIAAWLRKHIRYAEDEAHLLVSRRKCLLADRSLLVRNPTSRRRALKQMSSRVPLVLRPIARFFYVLIWRRGFLDGRYGVLYAFMLSVYEGMISVLAANQIMQEKAAPRRRYWSAQARDGEVPRAGPNSSQLEP